MTFETSKSGQLAHKIKRHNYLMTIPLWHVRCVSFIVWLIGTVFVSLSAMPATSLQKSTLF